MFVNYEYNQIEFLIEVSYFMRYDWHLRETDFWSVIF